MQHQAKSVLGCPTPPPSSHRADLHLQSYTVASFGGATLDDPQNPDVALCHHWSSR